MGGIPSRMFEASDRWDRFGPSCTLPGNWETGYLPVARPRRSLARPQGSLRGRQPPRRRREVEGE